VFCVCLGTFYRHIILNISVGESVTLPCQVPWNVSVEWNYRASENSTSISIADQLRDGRVTMDGEGIQRDYNITLPTVRIEDSGLYECIIAAWLGPRCTYKLHVYG